MYMILFEAEPEPSKLEEYLAWAKQLNTLLPSQPGFIRIDRAKSIMTEDKIISVSFWESEEAIDGWASHPEHRQAQAAAKTGLFRSMRITRLKVLSQREVETD